MEDPRDGLTLFGPLDEGKPYGIRHGVIGTADGIRRLKNWARVVQGPISNRPPVMARPMFPGFEAAFRIPWNPQPVLEIEVPDDELSRCVHYDDRHQRVYSTVQLFSQRIVNAL